MKWRSGPQIPDRSGLPSLARGAGPAGAGLFSTPPPVKTEAPCAAAGWGARHNQTAAARQPDTEILNLILLNLPFWPDAIKRARRMSTKQRLQKARAGGRAENLRHTTTVARRSHESCSGRHGPPVPVRLCAAALSLLGFSLWAQ